MWKCITENSLRISGLRGEVQEQMEDGFGEALLNSNYMDKVAESGFDRWSFGKGSIYRIRQWQDRLLQRKGMEVLDKVFGREAKMNRSGNTGQLVFS